MRANRKRPKSLNPLIYPEWWGDPMDAEITMLSDITAVAKEDNDNYQGNFRRKRKDESSLDDRLKQAKEAADKLDQMFKER